MTEQTIITLLILTGAGHIAVSLGSLAVPTLLDWKKHLDVAPPLLRQVFWTYSSYTKMTIIAFGLVSIFGASDLVGICCFRKFRQSRRFRFRPDDCPNLQFFMGWR